MFAQREDVNRIDKVQDKSEAVVVEGENSLLPAIIRVVEQTFRRVAQLVRALP